MTSNGCVNPVASSPAVAPEVMESNGPEDGEFNGEAHQSTQLITQNTSKKSLGTLIQSDLYSSIGRIS